MSQVSVSSPYRRAPNGRVLSTADLGVLDEKGVPATACNSMTSGTVAPNSPVQWDRVPELVLKSMFLST